MSNQPMTDALTAYSVDPAHSEVGFTVRHMGFSKVHGSFGEFNAVVEMAGEDLSTLKTNATIVAASVTTQDQKRDEHLRSADFFDVESHPELTFESTGVSDISGNSFKLHGKLTIRGISKDVVLDAEFLGEGVDPWGGTRVGLEAGTTINRKEFGLNWNAALEAGGVLVSDKVQLNLQIQAVRQA